MFVKFITGLDIFGHAVGVNYRGDSSYKTGFGAILTIISFILIFLNTSSLVVSFVTREDQIERSRTITESLVDAGDLNLQENKFDIAFTTGKTLDPKYGTWKATKFVFDQKEKDYKAIDLNVELCGDRINKSLISFVKERTKDLEYAE